MRIKVMHVAQANGGVESYLKTFIKASDRDIYENYIVLSEQYRPSKEFFEQLGAKVIFIDMCRELSINKDLKSIRSIRKLIKEIRPDIIYSHSSKAGGVVRIPAKIMGVPNIYNPHGWAFDMDSSKVKKCIYVLIERILSRFTDKIICISDYEKELALKKKITIKEKLEVIENGIDIKKFANEVDNSDLKRMLGINDDDIVIGMVARITEQKSPYTFLNIAEQVTGLIPGVKFIMVGDGDLKDEIQSAIEKRGLENKCLVTGWVDNPKEYIDLFDYALLTSKWEGFGLAVTEYMACKKVVLASNVGGITNIIEDNIDGFLIDDYSGRKYVEKIMYLQENPAEKEKVIENAYNKVLRKYSSKQMINKHEAIFEIYFYEKSIKEMGESNVIDF